MPRLSAKNQLTVPVAVLEDAGLRPGDEVIVRPAGAGRLEVERVDDLVSEFAGKLDYPADALRELRDGWDR
jgi:bifunctional DNA-binding transcriptional regulator/antitoxin component of YhaV-PrlF toxin-antitoxin module